MVKKLFVTLLISVVIIFGVYAESTVSVDSSSSYNPTTIVNGTFSTKPWMTYVYNDTTYDSSSNGYTSKNVTPSSITKNGVDGGWNSTETETYNGNLFEWSGNAVGVFCHFYADNTALASAGRYYLDMNCNHPGVLYQDLTTVPGDVIRWSLQHAPSIRGSAEEVQDMHVEVGAPNEAPSGTDANLKDSGKAIYKATEITTGLGTVAFANTSELTNLSVSREGKTNSSYSDTVAECNALFKDVAGVYIVPSDQTVTRFAFVSDDTSTPTCGNLLSNLTFNTLIGNLHGQYNSDGSVSVYGYWGETDTSKKLIVKSGSNVNQIDMTSVCEKNFKITIPSENINSNSTTVEVYHQDYESAKRTVHIHRWKYFTEGKYYIKAYCNCSSTSECEFAGIENSISLLVLPGNKTFFKKTITPENATNRNLKWTSSDSSVLKVNDDGLITALKRGSATITGISTDGSGKSASYGLTVSDAQDLNKLNASVTLPAVITGLTYTGSAQDLVTAGTTDGGQWQYKLSGGSYSATVPQATDAGTYTVYYKLEGGDDYNDIAEATCYVTVAKADQTAPGAPTVKTVSDATVTLNSITTTGFGNINYSYNTLNTAPSSGWQESTEFTLQNATQYYFFARYAGDTNHNPSPASEGTGAETEAAATKLTVTSAATFTKGKYVTSTTDESAILVNTSENVTFTNATVIKSGDSDGGDNCNFYGLNAAVLVKGGSTTTITGGTVTSDATGANGVFSYGGNNAQNDAAGNGTTVIISDTTITTTGSGSGGIMTTGGGITSASNLTVTTNGQSSAAIRTDRGGGTVTVNEGTYTTNGLGSPAIYSTAGITVSNAELVSNLSEGVVIEGKNSVTLNSCSLTANNTQCNGNATFKDTVMIYQSMSGDANSGTSEFTMNGGSITSNSGHVFHVTNTTAVINIDGVSIINNDSSDVLLSVCDDGWSGASNIATLNASNQTLNGKILVGSDSTLTLNLKDNSTFTGCISGSITNAKSQSVSTSVGTVNVTIEEGSSWVLTADTTITSINDKSRVTLNGYTLTVLSKDDATVKLPAAITGLTYTGSAQNLVTAGTTNGGQWQYKLSGGSYSATVPQVTNAGTYTVYYKLEGGDDYNDIEEASCSVTIAKADQSAPAAPEIYQTYGTANVYLNEITTNGYGNVQYGYSTSSSTAPTNWQESTSFEDLPSNKECYFFARYEGDANHNPGFDLTKYCYHNTSCFVAGTKITMADGSTKNIEDIKVGDSVKSYDVVEGKFYITAINKTWESSNSTISTITLSDGTNVKCTPNHPICTIEGFKSVDPEFEGELLEFPSTKMKVGDIVVTENGTFAVTSIETNVGVKVPVYNLSVESNGNELNNTFIANGIVAHNKD